MDLVDEILAMTLMCTVGPGYCRCVFSINFLLLSLTQFSKDLVDAYEDYNTATEHSGLVILYKGLWQQQL